tara:strand:- start:427 stop:630 length:204 start_codon:yes stop_codon:yes gene_type:complete
MYSFGLKIKNIFLLKLSIRNSYLIGIEEHKISKFIFNKILKMQVLNSKYLSHLLKDWVKEFKFQEIV